MLRNGFGQEVGPPIDGWTARLPPPRTPLVGSACRLEPLDADRHGRDLFAAYREAPDGRDWTYLPLERPERPDAYLEIAARQAASVDPLHHAIVAAADGRAAGTAAFLRIDPANGVIEIGHIALSPRLQRSRAGTEALYLLMRRAFDELGYRRLEWKCDALNAPSRRAADRLGFSFEGIFRQAIVTKGRNRDTAWYAMLDHDWAQVRAGFERWLDPANFDTDGRQRAPLATLRGGGV